MNPKNWRCTICGQALSIEQVWTICHGAKQALNLAALCEVCCDEELAKQQAQNKATTPVLYEVVATKDGKAEAVSTLWFCSDQCRRVYETDIPVSAGYNDDWIDGTVCEECAKPLVREVAHA